VGWGWQRGRGGPWQVRCFLLFSRLCVQARWRARVHGTSPGWRFWLLRKAREGLRVRARARLRCCGMRLSLENDRFPRAFLSFLSFLFLFLFLFLCFARRRNPSRPEAKSAWGVALHRELNLGGSTPRQQANRSLEHDIPSMRGDVPSRDPFSALACTTLVLELPVSRFYSVSFSVSSSLSYFSRVLSHSHSPSLALSFDIEVLLEFRFVSRFRFFL